MSHRFINAMIRARKTEELLRALRLERPDRMAGLIGRLAQDMRADRVRHENQKKDECDLERGQCRPFVDHKADEGQHAA